MDGREGFRSRETDHGEAAAPHVDALQTGALRDVQLAGGGEQSTDGQFLDVLSRDGDGIGRRQDGISPVRVEAEPLKHLAGDGKALPGIHRDVHVADIQQVVDTLNEDRGVASHHERLVRELLPGLDAHPAVGGRGHVGRAGADAGVHPFARGELERVRAGSTTEHEGSRGIRTRAELAVLTPGADIHEPVFQPVVLGPILRAASLRHWVGVVGVPALLLVNLRLHIHQARDLVVGNLREILLGLKHTGGEVVEGRTSERSHTGEHIVHHRRALRVEGRLDEVIKAVVLALPVEVAGIVGVVQLHVVRLAVLADVVRLEDGIEVVLHPADLERHRVDVVVGVLRPVVGSGKEEDEAVVVQGIVHVHIIRGVGLEVCGSLGDDLRVDDGPLTGSPCGSAAESLVLGADVQRLIGGRAELVHTGGYPRVVDGRPAEKVILRRTERRIRLGGPVGFRPVSVGVVPELGERAAVIGHAAVVQVVEVEERLHRVDGHRVGRIFAVPVIGGDAEAEVDVLRPVVHPRLLVGVVGHVIVPRNLEVGQLAVVVRALDHKEVRGCALVEAERRLVALACAPCHQVLEHPRVILRLAVEEQVRLLEDGDTGVRVGLELPRL